MVQWFQKFRRVKNHNFLEADEIFFDAEVLKSADSKLEQPIWKRTLHFFLVLSILAILTLFFKTGDLTVFKNKYYASLADFNSKRFSYDFAPRGLIFDRSGERLVYNIPSLDVVLIPNAFPRDSETENKIFDALSKIVDFKRPKTISLLSNQIILKENVAIDDALKIELNSGAFTGVKIQKNFLRKYVDGPIFAHLVGYVGKPKEEEIKSEKYVSADNVGKDGIEFFYDEILRGINGVREFDVDVSGGIKNDFLIRDVVSGEDIHLSIDAELQKVLFNALEKNLTHEGGAAIAINPQNGEMLALVSEPSFDNNLFSLKDPKLKNIFNNNLHPFFNRAIGGEYPPGSTVKPFVGVGALEEKLISVNSKILDPGAIRIKNPYNDEVVYSYSSYASLGLLSMRQALAYSSNVFFYILGGGLPSSILVSDDWPQYENFPGLGIDGLNKYFRMFGFGEKVGLGLAGESDGFIPTSSWKENFKKERWLTGDTYNTTVGQGDFTATPLQLSMAFSAIANGGLLLKPHIIKDAPKEIVRLNFVDSKNIDAVKEGLRDSVLYGTSKGLNSLSVAVGGKTGTAQRGNNDKDMYAWSVSFAPYDNPTILIVVVVEGGKGGSTNAVPVAKETLEWYFNKNQNLVNN